MTRHSNTMVFGTNTSFGISVGADATTTPNISVGYKRQEAVIMPLVANTSDNGTVMSPCAQHNANGKMPDTCLLRGQVGPAGGRGFDTYSVLASFGAKFGADSNPPHADGQIAQYFATGLAARLLAENGGASVIATGDAARANSRSLASVNMAKLIASPEIAKIEKKNGIEIDKSKRSIATAVAGSGADLAAKLSAMDAVLDSRDFRDVCKETTVPATCSNQILLSESLDGLTAKDWADAAAAAQ